MLCPFKVFRFFSLPVFNMLLLNHSKVEEHREWSYRPGAEQRGRMDSEEPLCCGSSSVKSGAGALSWRAAMLLRLCVLKSPVANYLN